MAAFQSNNRDLTNGSILDKLLLVAVPIMGIQLMQMLYNLTDMFWLGRIGSDAVTASGTAGMFLWLSQALMMVGRMGSEIGVSQSIGQGDTAKAKKYSQLSLYLAVILGILFALVMILFRRPLIGFFNLPDPEVAKAATAYLAMTALGIPATYITAALTGSFNASGNSRTPFFINAAGLITNIILDPLLIFTAGMGVQGAAIATVAAQYLVALLFLIAVGRSRNRPFEDYSLTTPFSGDKVKQILWWSIPIVLESMLFTLLSMMISRIVAGWGIVPMAAQRVGSQIESLSWLIGGGFASAVTAFTGQNYGAAKWKRIRKGIRISMLSMTVWGVIVTLVLFFAGGFIFRLFLPDPAAVSMGIVYLRMLAFCQIVACLEYNSAGVLRGIGRTIPPSIVSICGNIIRLPLVYFLSTTSLGINGIWLGISAGAALRSIWLFIWFLLIARKMPKENLS